MVQPLWRTVWKFLKKLPYDPALLLLGMHLKELKTRSQRDICISMFTAALFMIAKVWKQPKCPLMDEWIKTTYIHTMEYYSA